MNLNKLCVLISPLGLFPVIVLLIIACGDDIDPDYKPPMHSTTSYTIGASGAKTGNEFFDPAKKNNLPIETVIEKIETPKSKIESKTDSKSKAVLKSAIQTKKSSSRTTPSTKVVNESKEEIQKKPITIGVSKIDILSGFPVDGKKAPYASQFFANSYGITESLFVKERNDLLVPHIAESWETPSDESSIKIKLRQDVKWWPPVGVDEDFGNLTAHDVAWWFNVANPAFNESSGYRLAHQLLAKFGEAKALDDFTLEVAAPEGSRFNPLTIKDMFGEWKRSLEIFSKTVHDSRGPEWMHENIVGTGPMRVVEWSPGESGVLESTPYHYKHVAPDISRLTLLQVPDVETKLAMLRSGQVDAISAPISKIREMESEGYVFHNPMNVLTTVSITNPGNLWERYHAGNGSDLEPWKSPSYEEDFPSIGNPWIGLVPDASHAYEDLDNPPGVTDMEQARLVRQALFLAIDRKKLIQEVWGGVGKPIPVEYVGPEFEAWEPDREITRAELDKFMEDNNLDHVPTYAQIGPWDDHHWTWEPKYDPLLAEKILESAGYPIAEDGYRLQITLNEYGAKELSGGSAQAADMIVDMWKEIGVQGIILRENAWTAINPRLRSRTQVWPILKNCLVENSSFPSDFPFPIEDTSTTRPAWGCGFESQFLTQMISNIRYEPDDVKREELHKKTVDWMIYWRLYIGLVELPSNGYLVNPEVIETWDSRQRFVVPAGMWNIGLVK